MNEITVTKENFEKEVIGSDKPVMVDFWASWCAPCMMLAPTVSEIAEEYADTVKVCKVNVDDEPELAAKYNISSIPAVYVFKNGQPAASSIGYVPKENLLRLIGE